jgi:hypothetical protein
MRKIVLSITKRDLDYDDEDDDAIAEAGDRDYMHFETTVFSAYAVLPKRRLIANFCVMDIVEAVFHVSCLPG